MSAAETWLEPDEVGALTTTQPNSWAAQRRKLARMGVPFTPNAARLRIIVGADPRLPAIAMIPHSMNDTMIPTTETSTPCQKEMPK